MTMNPAPKRRRSREDDRNEIPTSFLPADNPPARRAYICALVGMIPVFGLIFGPFAVLFGLLGRRHIRKHPEAKGYGHATVSIWLGVAEFVTNAIGLTMIASSLGWLNPD